MNYTENEVLRGYVSQNLRSMTVNNELLESISDKETTFAELFLEGRVESKDLKKVLSNHFLKFGTNKGVEEYLGISRSSWYKMGFQGMSLTEVILEESVGEL